MCELVGDDVLADCKPELFLLGTLSLVDALLDRPMSSILDELSLSGELTQALLGHASRFRPVLDFVRHNERGDWAACAALGGAHGIVDASVGARYNEAVGWATQVLQG